MKVADAFAVNPGWRVLLKDIGIEPAHVLRRAGLPADLFSRPGATLRSAEYFSLWSALEAEADDPELPLRIVEAISVESFDAPIFAALCSPDLRTALRRIARYKPLIGPMVLTLEEGELMAEGEAVPVLVLDMEWLHQAEMPPCVLAGMELVFFVHLARLGTRERIVPVTVRSPKAPEAPEAMEEFLGCPVESGPRYQVVFHQRDATRPFLTANAQMWEFFQPELRKRLSELDAQATTVDRVRGALLELLPSGEATLGAVAKRLAVSTRTLQRRLQVEEEHFQSILDRTREDLARHYLTSSSLSGAEISFLLGYEDPSSFFRAFQAWTGETPQAVRAGG